MVAHTHGAPDLAFWPLALMWFGMMVAMMAPTAWPWVRGFHRFTDVKRGAAVGTTMQFAAGYLLAWLGYAIVAALLQRGLQLTGIVKGLGAVVAPRVSAAIFLSAGLYQFAPLKRACLAHCRTPLGYFLSRWVGGPTGAVRMGLGHGLFCVGCCWALMATALAVGVMNAWWMATLGVLALAEQFPRRGQLVRALIGAAFLVAGVVMTL